MVRNSDVAVECAASQWPLVSPFVRATVTVPILNGAGNWQKYQIEAAVCSE
jgi:hypothetical protein